MKVTQHGDYLTKLTRMWFVNCFLVREADGLTLVDASFAGNAKRILAVAQDLGVPITRIVLTHAHIDHAGSVNALRAALPDVEVCAGAREARFLAGDSSLDDDEPQAPLKGGYVTLDQPVTRALEPGDCVGSLEVHASLGHTPGHIALFDTRDQTLFAGDAWVVMGGLSVVG
ncbi:MAG: MBL fold metallo-hydrolase, partial [Anaerolineae bacterium]|nr:MBL fold metallo-hydrolase [Anaerolineae bacterium]